MEANTTGMPADAPVPRRRRFMPRWRRPRVSKRWWLGTGAALVAVGVVFSGGYLALRLSEQSDEVTNEMAALSQQLDELRQAIGMTEGTGASDAGAIDLSQSITDRVLDATRSTGTERTIRSIESVAARFETDRLLLAEMRKTPPREPREAQRFWANIKPLALRSDPSLGPLLDRVARSLPAYLQWLASAPDADPAVALGLLQSGASNYLRAVDEFWQRVLLVVIDRIDVLVDLTLE